MRFSNSFKASALHGLLRDNSATSEIAHCWQIDREEIESFQD